MISAYIPLICLLAAAFAGMYGHGSLSAVGASAIFLFEMWYAYGFIMAVAGHKQRHILFLLGYIAVCTYVFFFRYINNLELWVDEIQVIRFGQLPLGNIARTVLTEHVAVPPLDYWNMWIWQHVASLVPVANSEFAYRVPYMGVHVATALVFAMLGRRIAATQKASGTFTMVIGFFLYFFNPLPFMYSYEIRFYAMTLLGAAVVLMLFFQKRLYDATSVPLVLLFCLNSVYQFIILAPFIVLGIIDPTTRKKAIILGVATLVMAVMILPAVYIPGPIPGVSAGERISQGLLWLRNFYFDGPWKLYAAYIAIALLVVFRKQRAVLLLAVSLLYVGVVVGLDNRYNYRYFGAKHFLFVIPFCTVAVMEVCAIGRTVLFRVCVTGVVVWMFFWPFYRHLQKIYAGELLMTKAPMGLKYIFQHAMNRRIGMVIVDYGNASEESVRYYNAAISWYADRYPNVSVTEPGVFDGCTSLRMNPSAVLYSVSGVPDCARASDFTITELYDSALVTLYE